MTRKPVTALIVVDLQNDFVPGGALAVNEGHRIIPLVDELLSLPFDVKVATKDWHPKNHGSFAQTHGKRTGDVIILQGIEQILWPTHCVQGSLGADFASGWNTNKIEKVFHKGTETHIDSYSTFFDNGHLHATGLEEYLRKKSVTDVYLVGLATDYCVKYSVLDACKLGFNTYVIVDACRGVNLKPQDTEQALQEMKAAGAHLVMSNDITEL